ncbi:putative proline iminopeptidase [Usnea florida]
MTQVEKKSLFEPVTGGGSIQGNMSAAKLLGRRTHQMPGRMNVSELFFEVPKDYSKPQSGTLRLFARSVERFERAVDASKKEVKQPPWFLYLQGGPGMPCKSPQSYAWTNFVLDKGYQILFLDQRGTGLSSTITARTLATEGGPAEQANFLKNFRADSIVKDCEAIRRSLTADFPEEKKKWSILGQSFGGFCALNYLSRFPEGLQEVFTAGGLPPLVQEPRLVYDKLFGKVKQRNKAYYLKYAEDIRRVKDIVRHIQKEDIKLPSGGKLSVLRLRQLGMYFGFHGTMDDVHEMITRLTSDLNQFGFFTRPTLEAFGAMIPFDTLPLYALLHEPIYARGSAPGWAADRSMSQYPEFAKVPIDGPEPILFTGEMVFREMFKDFDELQGLLDTADRLAYAQDWPELYDEAQLAKNEVPVYSATYIEDMYVDFEFAKDTASKIKGCKTFVTNVLYHDALVHKTDELMKELFALRDDTID